MRILIVWASSHSECFWTLKTCFFSSSFFSKLDNVSSPIISQSLTVTHALCQENVFIIKEKFNTFCCLFKELHVEFELFSAKNDKIASARAQLVTVISYIISRELHVYDKFYIIHKIKNPKGMVRDFTEGMLFVIFFIQGDAIPPQFEPWHLLLIVYCFTHYS